MVLGAGRVLALVLTACAFAGAAAAPASAQLTRGQQTIRSITVEGNQRIESSTVISYLTIQPGDPFDPAGLDTSLKVLFATGLFADVSFEQRGAVLVVNVVENPVINRVIFEGNRAIKDAKLQEEIEAQPRSIFTRARAQADTQRLIELYRRSGRFAATITPKVVEQPQNRVDVVFEIAEGPVTGVRRINFIGNRAITDRKLRSELVTQESKWWKLFSSNDNYDPDRLEFDRELLRQFYTDRGYADFRVVSAVAELTPDQKDFFITFVVEEGDQYDFGEVTVTTELETLNAAALRNLLPINSGTLFRQSLLEDGVDSLTFAAGASGYAFVDIRPRTLRNREERTIDVNFLIAEAPRVYIDRIDVVGNTRTVDTVIRREIALVEGDAFNRVLVNRSRNRIRALGFFKEVEITELPGEAPDRAVLQVEVVEQPTGELSFGAGFSSVDAFLVDFSVTERNLRGRGQFLRFRISASSRSQVVDIRFTEPRFLGRNLAAGFDLFNTRQDFVDEAAFETNSIGGSLRLGIPLTENTSAQLRYTVRNDDVRVFSGASSPIALESGSRLTSVAGITLAWSRLNDPIEPTRGFDVTVAQDFAGVGGDVQFLSTELNGNYYRGLLPNIVFSLSGTSGYITPWGNDDIRINDRYFKGGSSFRGFDTAGLGPRLVQVNETSGALEIAGDALGGQFFAIGTAELSFPLGLPEQYGVKAALFTDFGTLGVIGDDIVTNAANLRIEESLSIRASAGLSLFWRSPFGPIRFDFSEVLAQEDYDKTETFRFSTSTRF